MLSLPLNLSLTNISLINEIWNKRRFGTVLLWGEDCCFGGGGSEWWFCGEKGWELYFFVLLKLKNYLMEVVLCSVV